MYVNTLLVTTYKEALEQLLSSTDRLGGMQIGGGIAQLFHGTTVGGQVADMSRRQVMDAFDGTSYNNFDVSAGYVAKLHESLGQELKRVFAGGNKKDEEQARECMSELTNANQSLRKSLEEAITRLAGGIERFFGPQLAAFASLDYEMSNGDYGESPAVADLIEAVEATLEPFRGELRPANFDCLVITIVEQIVAPSLEKLVLGRKALCFSLVGAMQFDKDLRLVLLCPRAGFRIISFPDACMRPRSSQFPPSVTAVPPVGPFLIPVWAMDVHSHTLSRIDALTLTRVLSSHQGPVWILQRPRSEGCERQTDQAGSNGNSAQPRGPKRDLGVQLGRAGQCGERRHCVAAVG